MDPQDYNSQKVYITKCTERVGREDGDGGLFRGIFHGDFGSEKRQDVKRLRGLVEFLAEFWEAALRCAFETASHVH